MNIRRVLQNGKLQINEEYKETDLVLVSGVTGLVVYMRVTDVEAEPSVEPRLTCFISKHHYDTPISCATEIVPCNNDSCCLLLIFLDPLVVSLL